MCALVAVSAVSNVEHFAARVWSARGRKRAKDAASAIVNDVLREGDVAVMRYERKFGATAPKSLRVTRAQVQAAHSRITRAELAAVRAAAKRLRATEVATKAGLREGTLRREGITLRREFVPIASVGCYVPGGAARYPSSAVMSIIPARVAGVPRIVVASPPGKDGEIDALTLVAADICGATEIYRMGGAQAIAALAHGTHSIQPVDKIVGPGGPFVTAAKHIVSRTTAIDMMAGPTELGIVADSTANARYIALDLVSQAEHSADARCFLVTSSARLAKNVASLIDGIVASTDRSSIVRTSISQNAFIAVCKSQNDALRLADLMAPEHVQVMTRSAQKDAARIRSAGMVLLGDTPSAASDYALGSNHVLPTNRNGRTRGPLSVIDFVKLRVTAKASRAALQSAMPHIDALTSAEGLPGHAAAVRERLK